MKKRRESIESCFQYSSWTCFPWCSIACTICPLLYTDVSLLCSVHPFIVVPWHEASWALLHCQQGTPSTRTVQDKYAIHVCFHCKSRNTLRHATVSWNGLLICAIHLGHVYSYYSIQYILHALHVYIMSSFRNHQPMLDRRKEASLISFNCNIY